MARRTRADIGGFTRIRRKVFTKLGVSSRRELTGALAHLGRSDLSA